jgi:spore coat polysaccharide biosynthesis protein SpsF
MILNINNMDLIVQARTGSSRLPNKIIYNSKDGITFLEYFYKRIKRSKLINRIIIATTIKKEDDIICDICERNNWLYFRGSENNVLERFYECSKKFNVKNIIRITSDCPLIDYNFVDEMITEFYSKNYKFYEVFYEGNHGFPDGFNPQIFTFETLEEAFLKSTTSLEKEHVAPYMIKNFLTHEFKIKIDKNKYNNINFNRLHLSLDTKQDLINLRNIINYFVDDLFSLDDILKYLNNLELSKLKLYYK